MFQSSQETAGLPAHATPGTEDFRPPKQGAETLLLPFLSWFWMKGLHGDTHEVKQETDESELATMNHAV